MIIRIATKNDAQQLLDIYAPYVLDSTFTFEYDIPSLQTFEQRITTTLQTHPYLVAEDNNKILGYAYADQVGGGEWRHGVGSYYVWSYYFHNYRNHSSSVSGQYFASSGRTSPGYDAQASAPKSLFGNRAYYDFW